MLLNICQDYKMELGDQVANIILNVILITMFLWGFFLASSNLRRVNTIEGDRFSLKDFSVSLLFGIIFGATTVFALSLALNMLLGLENILIPGYLLLALIVFLVGYPVYDTLNLAKPTSDSVTEIHRAIESKLIDRFKGGKAYGAAIAFFLIIYLLPVILLMVFIKTNFLLIIFLYFLLFPLFYLSYFAAAGVFANIIRTRFNAKIPSTNTIELFITNGERKIRSIKVWIAYIPLLLAIYSILQPILRVIQGEGLSTASNEMVAYISLFNTVVFGIQGFFKRFWNRKSKTKSVDFYFSGYIMAGIGLNMLINFLSINSEMMTHLFAIELLGMKPLEPLTFMLDNYVLLVPVIIIQSLITIIYVFIMLIKGNSELQANIQMGALNDAFKLPSDKDLQRLKRLQSSKKILPEVVIRTYFSKADYVTIFQALVMPPVFNEYGIDINEELRKKAAYSITILADEQQDRVGEIINFLLNTTVESQLSQKQAFISREAFQALGEISKKNPAKVLDRLLEVLPESDMLMKRYILETISIIGENEANTLRILGKRSIQEMLKGKSFEIRNAGIQALVSMGSNLSDISVILEKIYQILDSGRELNEKGKQLTESFEEDEYILEMALASMLKIVPQGPNKVQIQKILPFLYFKCHSKDEDTDNYILFNSLKILAYLAYYFPDQLPLNDITPFLDDERNYIRYVAVDLLGNYSLQRENDEIVGAILKKILLDPDPDVRDMAIESISEFYIATKRVSISKGGGLIDIYDYVLLALDSDSKSMVENASEAVKTILPLMGDERGFEMLQEKMSHPNEEVVRDCAHTLGYFAKDTKYFDKIRVEPFYYHLEKGEDSTKAQMLWTLGEVLDERIPFFLEKTTKWMFYEKNAEVRLNAIFAVGKMGLKAPRESMEKLFEKLDALEISEETQELELVYESLGNIGEKHPYYPIITRLQQGLIGDINPFCKDVVAKALYRVAKGMINRAVHTDRYKAAEDNVRKYLYPRGKQEYMVGNIIMMLLEGIQQKNLPESVIDIISDSLQDLLPYFAIYDEPEKGVEILNTVQLMLLQAYYSNYSNEILETVDRISSIKAFRFYVEEDETEILKKEAKQLAIQYTNDGQQFFDQGELFMELKAAKKYEYALKSYEIALEISPNEFYAPKCYEQMGKILKFKQQYAEAQKSFEKACHLYAFYDDVDNFTECEDLLREIKNKTKK